LIAYLLIYGIISGVWSSVLAVLFPAEVRFSGIAASYNLSVTVLSGFAPLIATMLINSFGWISAPIMYMAVCSAITFVATFFVSRYASIAEGPSLPT
jgi:ATP/ADP translocase